MGRPVYPHELTDPDFSWLISSFREAHPDYQLLDVPCMALVFVKCDPPRLGAELLPIVPEGTTEEGVDPELDRE